MADAYPIPGGRHRVEAVIDRSRFITTMAHAPSLRRTIQEVGGAVLDASYGAAVQYRAAVPRANLDRFAALLADRTAGRARL